MGIFQKYIILAFPKIFKENPTKLVLLDINKNYAQKEKCWKVSWSVSLGNNGLKN